MLQSQYYNVKLTKTQVDSILQNYQTKYTTEKNKIYAALDNLLKIVISDIHSFYNGMEEISKERKKIKEFENLQREYDILNSKIKEKTLNEHKLENDIQSLQNEILFLKNENKNQTYEKIEMKAPTTAKTKKSNRIFQNKKHVKINSEYLGNNTFNDSSKNNILTTNKKLNSSRNIFKSKKKNTTQKSGKINALSATKRKIENKSNVNNNKISRSPDIIGKTKNSLINNSNRMDKTIEKIKRYTMNKNNERIKKIQNIRFVKNKNKFQNEFKRNNRELNNTETNLQEYKKKALTIKNEKKESIKDDDLEKNKTYEYATHMLKLVESIPRNNKKTPNNYSDDEESKIKSVTSESSSSSSDSISEEINSEEMRNIDDEIKELQEDEDNILLIMNQIKELNINSHINTNS